MTPYELASAYAQYTNRCIFLTGKAGTGKTTFLKNLEISSNKQMAIIAPTGVAAINAGGSTIHSFFQLPPQLFLPTESARTMLFQEIQMRKQKIQVLRNLELLVIDEISMVRADLLDAIDMVLRHYRHRNQPFGGVQLLMIGDLFQLSPVAREQEWDMLRSYYEGPYFFQSQVFREVQPIYIELDKVYRQTNQQFVDVLNEVRNNCLSEASHKLLNSRFDPTYEQNEDDFHIILSTHNQKVDSINEEALKKLGGKQHSFYATIEGTFPEQMYPIEEELRLKVGARVMFVKNDSSPEHRYYNGKLGIVTAMNAEEITVESEDGEIVVTPETWSNYRYQANLTTETLDIETIGTFSHFPLRLAWAITIHKSQGLTFDNVIIDASDAFAAGQVYVALSRCRTLEGIVLLSRIPESALSNAQAVLRYTAAQPAIDEIAERLEHSQKEYWVGILCGLFDFRDMLRRIDTLRAITSREASYSEGTAAFLQEQKTKMEELQPIGERFQFQIRQMNQNGENLHGRLEAAFGYFGPKIMDIAGAIRKSSCTTDNKESRLAFEEVINELYLDIARQFYLMQRMSKQDSIEKYFEARKSFQIPQIHISANPEKASQEELQSNKPEDQLLRILFARRRQIANDADVPLYQIAKTDSLREIAKRQPIKKSELMKVKGFGKTKYEIWGEEILKICFQFRYGRKG